MSNKSILLSSKSKNNTINRSAGGWKNNSIKGFTLIELLVVIAIIGVLASVVLASLNSAREKGQIVAIKSNLKNMIPQMELSYSDSGVGNYSAISTGGTPNRPITTCIGPIAGMATAITNNGAKSRCLSTNYSGWSDLAQRWGASALIFTSTAPVKAWSASNLGVVTWDAADLTAANLPGGATKNWADANTACAATGGRLPTIEELKTLADAQCEALGSADCTVDSARNPPGFVASYYWSSTTVPSNPAYAYGVGFNGGGMSNGGKTGNLYVRCVR